MQNHCVVQWPNSLTEKLVLRCQIPPDHSQTLTRGWSKRCTDIMQTHLNQVRLLKEVILKETWLQLKNKFESSVEQPSNDEMLIDWDDASGIVQMCGLCSHVEQNSAVLKKIKEELELEFERTSRQITETLELQLHQIALLRKIDVALQFGDRATITLSDESVVIVGQPDDVANLKLRILQKVNGIVSSSCRCSQKLRFLKRPAVKEHFDGALARKNLQVIMLFQEEELSVLGFEQTTVKEAIEWIKSEVIEKRIDLKSQNFTLFKKWLESEAGNLEQYLLSEVFVDSTNIVITSVKDQFEAVVKRVRDFIDKTVVREEFVSLEIVVAQVMKLCAEQDIKQIELDLEQHNVKILLDISSRAGYRLSATVDGMRLAKESMKKLATKVKHKEYAGKDLSLVHILKDPLSRQMVVSLASKHFVVGKFSDELRVISRASVGNGKVLELMVGDIIQCPADVIINPANSRLQNGGGVAEAISRAGMINLLLGFLMHIKIY